MTPITDNPAPATSTPAHSADTTSPATPSSMDNLLARLRAIHRKNADPKHRKTRGAFGRCRNRP